MKRLIVLMLVLSVSVFAGDKKKQEHSAHKHDMKSEQHSAEMAKKGEGHVMISVPTIQCEDCVKTVETAVKSVDGVKSVKVDLDKKVAHVNFDPKKVKKADIDKAIAASGYDANDVKRDEKAHAKLSAHKHDMKSEQHSAEMAKKGEGHVMISVSTIQCGACVKTVETAVKKVDGIKSVKVDLDKKVAHVNFDPKKVKKEDIEKAIAASGYDANDVKRDEKAHAKLLSCCQSSR